jgi:hypothetical protein
MATGMAGTFHSISRAFISRRSIRLWYYICVFHMFAGLHFAFAFVCSSLFQFWTCRVSRGCLLGLACIFHDAAFMSTISFTRHESSLCRISLSARHVSWFCSSSSGGWSLMIPLPVLEWLPNRKWQSIAQRI